MRFFKYLIFLFLFLLSFESSAAYEYIVANCSSNCKFTTEPSFFARIEALTGRKQNEWTYKWFGNTLQITSSGGSLGAFGYRNQVADKCPESGTPLAVYFPNNSPIPTQTCKANSDGTFCVYKYTPYPNKKDPLVITTNAGQQIILNSVSSIPSPSCTPIFHKTTCDSNDPYGGCYKPPDDQCNRMADGSIYCPPDAPEPDVSDTCNGATYCKRPPQGCGKGYVSGSFNGQQLCVKTSPSTDNPSSPNEGDSGNTGEGTGTSTSTGTETTTTTTTNSDGSTSTSTSTTTTNNTTINNFKIDLSGVIAAVNAVSAQVISLKNELLTSISQLSSKLDSTNSKLDSTNSKLDTTNSKLTDLNASSLKQEQLLKDIRDKTVTDPDQPASVASTDLTETNSHLKDIKNWLTSTDGVQGEPGLLTIDQIQIEQQQDKFNWSAQCPAPIEKNTTIIGYSWTYSFTFDSWCSVLAKLSNYFLFAAWFGACLIIAGVRNG